MDNKRKSNNIFDKVLWSIFVFYVVIRVVVFVGDGSFSWAATLIPILLLIGGLYRLSQRCEACGSLGAMKEVGRKCIDKKPTQVKKTLKTKNSKGDVISTKEVYINATKYTYLVGKECKYCEHYDEVYDEEIKED